MFAANSQSHLRCYIPLTGTAIKIGCIDFYHLCLIYKALGSLNFWLANVREKPDQSRYMKNEFHKSFGFEDVETFERQTRIRRVFNAVAPRYDLMNDLMSFGIHRLWKRRMIRFLAPGDGRRIVDLAGGTGDVARLMARVKGSHIIVCDASEAMMRAGKPINPSDEPALDWLAAEGEALPLGDESIDIITIAFGLRNMTQPEASLRECVRVLKPGGRFVCLEFSRPVFWLRPFYDFYSYFVIPRLGAFVAKEPMAYQYLIESIRRFPGQNAVKRLLEEAGFENVGYRNLSFGIACIHYGVKPGMSEGVSP